ncbi:hypothetical protein [Aureimonas sp. AU40]|uniref:hypothetical protein n=1 Tax=Aureimonas sp. AU40 TaxID=1637747 RepID=UPI000AC704FF|nr:hypothetical protein [Aureimonas sp. AU40]
MSVLLWSARRDAAVLSLAEQGVSVEAIAAHLSLPVDAVARRLCVLDVRRRAA